ncbi:MAG: FG-GAP repeat domain-containing protein [Planctomycetia bacterium]
MVLPGGSLPTEMVSADFNADGYGDFAVGTADSAVLLYVGQGDGTFIYVGGVYAFGSGAVADMEVGDLDGDAYPDVACASAGSGTPWCVRNLGSGAPLPQVLAPVSSAVGLGGVALADIDLDGDLDVLVSSPDLGIVTTRLGDGQGGFSVTSAPYPVGLSAARMATGDFDADGYPDVAVLVPDLNELRVLRGTGSPVFVEAPASPVQLSEGPRRIVTGDFNVDGLLDLAISAETAGKVNLLLGFGSAAFVEPLTSPLLVGDKPVGIAAGSIDRDGLLDLVVADQTGLRGVWRSTGPGTFAAASTDVAAGDNSTEVVLLDIDADGVLDMVVADGVDGTLTVLLGNRDIVRPI